MLILVLVTTYAYQYAECRVHCQDLHALPFQHQGFSCPVNCNNVINAVETLKLMDVDNIIAQDKQEQVDEISSLVSNVSRSRDSRDYLYLVCDRILKNKVALNEVQTKLGKFVSRVKSDAMRVSIKQKMCLKKKICSKPKDDDAKFVSYFTKLLNKYVYGKMTFTEEFTSLLVERYLSGSELRQGVIDVQKLLHFLKRALLKHRVRVNPARITLKSQHCLTIFIPGCFCLSGYVESEGQCVMPKDCFEDTQRTEYLPRVIIM